MLNAVKNPALASGQGTSLSEFVKGDPVAGRALVAPAAPAIYGSPGHSLSGTRRRGEYFPSPSEDAAVFQNSRAVLLALVRHTQAQSFCSVLRQNRRAAGARSGPLRSAIIGSLSSAIWRDIVEFGPLPGLDVIAKLAQQILGVSK